MATSPTRSSPAEIDFRTGRFTSALRRLKALPAPSAADKALLIESCEMCGLLDEAQIGAMTLAKSDLPVLRARGKAVLGGLASLTGELDTAEANFREARLVLQQAGEHERACEVGIRQLAALLDMRFAASVEDLAAELQKQVSRFGNRRLLCMFHVVATNFHASAGRLELARTHGILAHSHLKAEPNCWLESSLALAESGLAFNEGALADAIAHGKAASRLAEESGHAWCRAAAATTCAFLFIRIGSAEEAAHWIQTAQRLSSKIAVLRTANLDNVAQFSLLRHDIEGIRRILELLEVPETLGPMENSWYDLAVRHTRIRLHRALGNWEAVERVASAGLQIAETRSDPNSVALFSASRAESLAILGKAQESVAAVRRSVREFAHVNPATISEMDRALGVVLAELGEPCAAKKCVARAIQIAAHIHDAVLAEEAKRTNDDLTGQMTGSETVYDSILKLWQFAGIYKKPEALLPPVFGSAELTDIIEDARLATQGTLPFQDNLDYHVLPLQNSQSSSDQKQSIVVRSISKPLPRVATVLLIAAAESILFRSRRTALSRTDTPASSSHRTRRDFLVSPSMLQLLDTATRIASTSIPVLITGETGTGKEVLARFIHEASDRSSSPFVPVNCSALSRELLESTLFGHRRGAFTGASESFDGLVKGAEGGTLFLDEVGDLPLDLQPKFLRFLETGEILPLGSNQPAKVNVRVLAATNANLSDLVENGRFRADLYYRLNGIHFELPPLRSRRTEIPALARHLLERYAEEFGKGDLTLSPEAMEHLLIYDWPGNVRQLASELRRVAALADANGPIDAALFSDKILAGPPREIAPAQGLPTIAVPIDQDLERAIETVERAMIARALERTRGRVDDAARLLGISRKGLFLKRRRYGFANRQS